MDIYDTVGIIHPFSFCSATHTYARAGQEMTLLYTITHSSRLHDVKFSPRASGEGELLLAGAEDKKLAVYEVSSPPRLIAELIGHERRYVYGKINA